MKKKVLISLIVLSVVGLSFLISTYFMKRAIYKRSFSYSDELLANPLMGYAPPAIEETVSDDINLVYVDITWKELESEKGVYNWEAIEEENQFSRWQEEGKHLVLRFVLDYPSDKKHQDVPEWLTSELDDSGDWYNSELGKGFSPNYGDENLIAYYRKAVEAMGQRWGNEELISFIELGGLGHWGEWHVDLEAGIRQLPDASVREQYVEPWVAAFPKADLLMRRSFSAADKYQLGIYNDMAGDLESTDEWLDWIESGGVYDQTGEADIVAMPEVWQESPIGGEFTSSHSMKTMLVKNLEQTVELIRDSHTTFLGPKIAQNVNDNKKGYDTVLKNMGYRLWLSEADLKENTDSTKLTMTWQNSGVAPFYRNWQAYVYVQDLTGTVVEKVELPLDLSSLLPEDEQSLSVDLTTDGVAEATRNQYRISVGIVDPMTGKDAVHFAVKGQEEQERLVLFE
ncbi:DUF4832 domain-containing protein [Streptococcus chenjunshii]|uniref:DUF4832 domain-containing protein n=1 Tax=Streptococcus chenjunshii TaxID=2173853 RepID=A0A372KMY4_9STRE|nr:DUF4832 domain-containing protein [Streptococcus chenjunshii]AXQ79012.1 DUF4832 domain-containing protein [Streptococcus chenjunshii]RFU51439.1 DUF4832 domain-containing protein [Streptococcus chenjunshii]RFU53639.1 DUF4832 domain-containing protein [Streptococcus chenjunshii]